MALLPWPQTKARFPALGAWSLRRWTTREVLYPVLFWSLYLSLLIIFLFIYLPFIEFSDFQQGRANPQCVRNKTWVVSHRDSIWTLTRHPCESKITQNYINLDSGSLLHTKARMLGLTDTDFPHGKQEITWLSSTWSFLSSENRVITAFMVFESLLLYTYQFAFVAVTFKAILSIFTSIFF